MSAISVNLSWLWLTPLLTACVLFLMKWSACCRVKKSAHCDVTGKGCPITLGVSVVGALTTALLSLRMVHFFNFENGFLQMIQQRPWLPMQTGIRYVIGVDGVSVFLIVLTAFFFLVTLFAAWKWNKNAGVLGLFFLLESAMMGIFLSLDVFLFYVFWELSFVPLYFLVGMYGGVNRFHATLKFFLYGALGSVLMLLAFIFLYSHTNLGHGQGYASHLGAIAQAVQGLDANAQAWVFIAIAVAFAIKFPLFPLHSWLMDLYEAAPPLYTVMSGLILKTAAYGMVRFGIMLLPFAAIRFAQAFVILGTIGILYGALLAWQQKDLRRMMAYSTLSHMGFIVVGLFSLNAMGMEGAMYQMLNHTVVSAALFIGIQAFGNHYGHFRMDAMGGLASKYAWISLFFVIAVMGSVGLPGTGSFIGEYLILMGAFQNWPVCAVFCTVGVIFGAIYILIATKKILYGPSVASPLAVRTDRVLTKTLGWQMAVLCIVIFVSGFASVALLKPVQATIHQVDIMIFHLYAAK